MAKHVWQKIPKEYLLAKNADLFIQGKDYFKVELELFFNGKDELFNSVNTKYVGQEFFLCLKKKKVKSVLE